MYLLGLLNSFFFSNLNFVCKIRILFELRLGLLYSDFVLTLTVRPQYVVQHGFLVMVLNCSILGPSRILSLPIACFITFYVHRAPQQKRQYQCITYHTHWRSLLSENSVQISIADSNTKCMQIEFELYDQSSKIRSSFNIPSIYHFNLITSFSNKPVVREHNFTAI